MTARQSTFNFDLPTAMSGQDFIVSSSNQEALKWLGDVHSWKLPALIIYGAPSSGKTHLCQIWQEIYHAEELIKQDLSDQKTMLDLLSPNGFYVIDNLDDVIEENKRQQENLFHLYNYLFNNGGWLLLTSSVPPKELKITLPDLSSRLRGIPAVEIKDPDDQVLNALLIKLFDDRQIMIKPSVIAYLMTRLDRSYQAIHDAVQGLDQRSLQGKRPITIPLVREWFGGKYKNIL